jgi:hypothetical protein
MGILGDRTDDANKNYSRLIPLTLAALHYRMTREVLLRRVQRGEVAGEYRNGRWFVADVQELTTLREPGS